MHPTERLESIRNMIPTTSDGPENGSMSSDDSSSLARCIDIKKCLAGIQICVGVVLILLEVANYVTALCPYARSFVPGIWIGIIFVATGISNFMSLRVEQIQARQLSADHAVKATSASSSRIFWITMLICSSFAIVLSLSMIAFLAWFLHDMRTDLDDNVDVKKSSFTMTVVMVSLYCLMLISTLVGVVYRMRYTSTRAKVDQKNEITLQAQSSTTASAISG